MLINKNEVKASEEDEEDAVEFVGSSSQSYGECQTGNDCRNIVKEQLLTSERLNRTNKLISRNLLMSNKPPKP